MPKKDFNFNHLLSFGSADYLRRMENAQRWDILVELLTPLSSESNWNGICELFSSWRDCAEKSEALKKTNAGLQEWPATLRHRYSSWHYLFEDNQASEIATIIQSITILRRETQGNAELKMLAGSAYVSQLAILKVSGGEIYNDGLSALAGSQFLFALMDLTLEHLSMNTKEIALLSSGAPLFAIQRLRLADVGMTQESCAQLLKGNLVRDLANLDLSNNILVDDCASGICDYCADNPIQKINLSHNFIRDAGAMYMVKNADLSALNLSNNPIGEAQKLALVEISRERGMSLII